jgi:saccharopine dehydrogenase (NAD+, L-lysine-forming)
VEADAAVIAVLGAGGTIGPAIVRDLAESDDVERLLLLDVDGDRASAVAADHGLGKATAAVANAGEPAQLADAIAGAVVLINAASYRFNVAAMHAALAAGCHYVDLGGLFHVTRDQLELDAKFAAADLLAVLGIGASPGKTNVMAALAAQHLDEVVALHVSAAAADPLAPKVGMSVPYALETILDELTLDAMVLRAGALDAVPALTDGGEVTFPAPIGDRRTVFTLHSELATFESSFAGLDEASFRLSLAPELAARVETLAELGLADTDPVAVGDVSVSPRAVTLACLRRNGTARPPSKATIAMHVVDAEGRRGGVATHIRVEAVTVPHERWGIGGNVVSTAAPAAEAARLLAGGKIDARGVLPPELVFDPEPFLDALARTGCTVTVVP